MPDGNDRSHFHQAPESDSGPPTPLSEPARSRSLLQLSIGGEDSETTASSSSPSIASGAPPPPPPPPPPPYPCHPSSPRPLLLPPLIVGGGSESGGAAPRPAAPPLPALPPLPPLPLPPLPPLDLPPLPPLGLPPLMRPPPPPLPAVTAATVTTTTSATASATVASIATPRRAAPPGTPATAASSVLSIAALLSPSTPPPPSSVARPHASQSHPPYLTPPPPPPASPPPHPPPPPPPPPAPPAPPAPPGQPVSVSRFPASDLPPIQPIIPAGIGGGHSGNDNGYDDDDEERSVGDDGYETGSDGSSTTSLLYEHTYEHGRRYPAGAGTTYPLPNDDTEQDREGMKHHMMLEIMGRKLFFAPVSEPTKVLDIGTGTGIWAVEMGDEFPDAQICGIDISPPEVEWVPPNVRFLVDDCQDDWADKEDTDLVHFRFMMMVLPNVPLVLGHAYTALKPGGWIELQELNGVPLCDDDTMPADDPVKRMYDMAAQAWPLFQLSVEQPSRLRPILEMVGFVNISLEVHKIPIGPWARDPGLRTIGNLQREAVKDIMQSLAARPFLELGISHEQSQVQLAHARQGLNDLRVHRYFEYYFWWAQKPGGEG